MKRSLQTVTKWAYCRSSHTYRILKDDFESFKNLTLSWLESYIESQEQTYKISDIVRWRTIAWMTLPRVKLLNNLNWHQLCKLKGVGWNVRGSKTSSSNHLFSTVYDTTAARPWIRYVRQATNLLQGHGLYGTKQDKLSCGRCRYRGVNSPTHFAN